MSDWLSTLPPDLQADIMAIISLYPQSQTVFAKLYNHLLNEESLPKRPKTNGSTSISTPQQIQPPQHQVVQNQIQNQNEPSNSVLITLKDPIVEETIIFEIIQTSFISPIRKKMSLIFHLIERNGQPLPVLSIVHPTTRVPEISVIDLTECVKLCAFIPIVGNSSNPLKKSIALLCFWIKDEYIGSSAVKDPIVLQVNLDMVKKQMISQGKLPPDIEHQFEKESPTNVNMNPIQERIIDYFQRQFKLCGVNLMNYLPCPTLSNIKYTLNRDSAVAVSSSNSGNNNLIIVECHRGAKEGVLLFVTGTEHSRSYIIHGFKKPILMFDVAKIMYTSYNNITRLTFNLLLTVADNNEEKTLEFSMIDHAFFQVIDDFIKSQNINDNSFDDTLREKTKETKDEEGEGGAEEEPVSALNQLNESEDEEDDDASYNGGDGDNYSASGSDVDEEFDSDAGSKSDDSDVSEEEEEDGVFNKAKEEEDDED